VAEPANPNCVRPPNVITYEDLRVLHFDRRRAVDPSQNAPSQTNVRSVRSGCPLNHGLLSRRRPDPAEGAGLLNGNPPLGHPQFSSQILYFLPLHTSIDLGGVGSRHAGLASQGQSWGQSNTSAIRCPARRRGTLRTVTTTSSSHLGKATAELWNRRMHFYLGLFFLLFLWLFSLTGLLLNHGRWALAQAANQRRETRYEQHIHPPAGTSELERARDLMQQLGLVGEIDLPAAPQQPGRLEFNVGRPTEASQVRVDPRRAARPSSTSITVVLPRSGFFIPSAGRASIRPIAEETGC
jgi:hypothetical protein